MRTIVEPLLSLTSRDGFAVFECVARHARGARDRQVRQLLPAARTIKLFPLNIRLDDSWRLRRVGKRLEKVGVHPQHGCPHQRVIGLSVDRP